MFEGDLALLIPIVAVVVWSPIGRAIAGSINAVNEEMKAKAERIRRGASTWELHMGQTGSGSSSSVLPPAEDSDLAQRVKDLEEEIHHLREAAVMAPWSPKSIGHPASEAQEGRESQSQTAQQRRIAQ